MFVATAGQVRARGAGNVLNVVNGNTLQEQMTLATIAGSVAHGKILDAQAIAVSITKESSSSNNQHSGN